MVMDKILILTKDEQRLYDIVFNNEYEPAVKTSKIYDEFIRPHVKPESKGNSYSFKPKSHFQKCGFDDENNE